MNELELAKAGPDGWWNACSSRRSTINGDAANGVTCTVTAWTNTSITISSFHGYYGYGGDYVVKPGDKVAIGDLGTTSRAPAQVVLLVHSQGPA